MTMSAKERCSEDMEWSAEESIQLFFALEGLKPVGLNKHFYMACIAERLSKSLNREIPAESIWAYLRTLYNLDVLDEMEPLPFPNEQKDFFLPDTEFSVLMSRKQAEIEERKSYPSGTTALIANTIQANSNSTNTKQLEIKDKPTPATKTSMATSSKDLEKKIIAKLAETPKRTPKRTRGSMSLESNSPSTTPPPLQSNKRRRI